MVAGTTIMRTMVASINTAAARPNPIRQMPRSLPNTNGALLANVRPTAATSQTARTNHFLRKEEVSTDLRLVLNRRQQLRLHVALSAGLALILAAIWKGAGGGYFWPRWPILVMAAAIALHVLFNAVPPDRRRWFRGRATRGFVLHVGLTAIVSVMLIAMWSFAGAGYFWPGWPMLAFTITIGLHWLYALTQRIDYLEVSRTDAVDLQQSDLTRIERDLHDGAQARLVALGMNLGMAEQKFATDPAGARLLLSEAREGVGDALKELRDLVRGIRPPV
jgi:signal transduction histidine kinase